MICVCSLIIDCFWAGAVGSLKLKPLTDLGESLVLNLTFPDFDLDYDDLGGTLAWQTPSDATQARGNTQGVAGLRC